ncbi:MAG: AsmA-like C-terminal domain-containing protein [Alphaproteobacteria bacterium]|nr:AsmA-like C-terminal domain-containing protein [Alphaproteobacteria bacterium]
MLTQVAKIIRSVLAFAISLLLVAAAIIAWRLSTGERINAAFLNPYVRELLSYQNQDVRVQPGTVQAGWNLESSSNLSLQVFDTEIFHKNGQRMALIPNLLIEIAPTSFFYGVLAPEKITFFNPKLSLYRNKEGRVDINNLIESTTDPNTSQTKSSDNALAVIHKFIEDMLKNRNYQNPISFLRQLKILDSKVSIFDERTGLWLDIPKADITIERITNGLQANVKLELIYKNISSTFDLAIFYDQPSQKIQISGSMDNFPLDLLGNFDERIMFFQQTDIKVTGDIKLLLNAKGRAESGIFQIKIGAGMINLPLEGLLQQVNVQNGLVIGEISEQGNKLLLSSFQLATNHGVIDGTLDLVGLRKAINPSRRVGVAANLVFQKLYLGSILELWPEGMLPNVKLWVQKNLHQAVIQNAKMQTTAEIFLPEPAKSKVTFLEGVAEGRDILVGYHAAMPLFQAKSASVEFSHQAMKVDFFDGLSNGVQVSSGSLEIKGFQENTQTVSIRAGFKGPLSRILPTIQPIVRDAGLLKSGSYVKEGISSGDLEMAFPLRRNLTWDDVQFSVKAKLSELQFQNLATNELRVAAEGLILEVTKDMLTITGNMIFNKIPASFVWKRRLDVAKADDDVIVQFDVSTTVLKKWLQLPENTLDGRSVPVQVNLKRDATGQVSFALRSNLTNMAFYPKLSVALKKAGVQAELQIKGRLQDAQLLVVDDASLIAPLLNMRAKGNLKITNSFVQGKLVFTAFKIQETNLQLSEIMWSEKEIVIALGGGQVDVPVIRHIVESLGDQTKTSPSKRLIRILNNQPLDLLIGSGRRLGNSYVNLVWEENRWHLISVESAVGTVGRFSLRYGLSVGSANYMLDIFTDNAGELARILGIMKGLAGGNMRLSAEGVRVGAVQKLAGKLSIDRFLINPLQAFGDKEGAALLGFANADKLIVMDQLLGNFVLQDQKLSLSKLRTNGVTIGLTADGWLDFDQGQLRLEGDFVPFYAVNGLLSNIPILGHILTGGPGKGIFSAKYLVSGLIEKPTFQFSALSAVAPGFLREIFSFPEQ